MHRPGKAFDLRESVFLLKELKFGLDYGRIVCYTYRVLLTNNANGRLKLFVDYGAFDVQREKRL